MDTTTQPIYCVKCGKRVKGSARIVHMTTGGRLYAEDFSYRVRPSEDQGWFEIGSDCYRKVAQAGRAGLAL